MTDIRLMTDDEITKLNQGTIGTKTMTEVKAPTKTKKTTRTNTKNPIPAWNHETWRDMEDNEVDSVLSSDRALGQFNRVADSIELGKGKMVQGDLARIRQKLSAFGRSKGKKFVARASDEKGWVRIVRVAPKDTQTTQNDNVI